MYRNLHARVEAIVPILDRTLKEKCWEILNLCVKEQRQSWEMKSDGTYVRQNSTDVGIHQTLMQIAKARVTFVEESSNTSSD